MRLYDLYQLEGEGETLVLSTEGDDGEEVPTLEIRDAYIGKVQMTGDFIDLRVCGHVGPVREDDDEDDTEPSGDGPEPEANTEIDFSKGFGKDFVADVLKSSGWNIYPSPSGNVQVRVTNDHDRTDRTADIQAAVDICEALGGGRVVLPPESRTTGGLTIDPSTTLKAKRYKGGTNG